MNKAVIFDVDGTLIDGTEGIINSVEYAIAEMGLKKLSKSELITFVGPPIQNSVKEKFNLNDDDAQTFANIFRKKYAQGDVYLANVYDGVFDLLDFLKEKNFKLGVATYKREDYAIKLVKHFKFDKYFDSVCGADNENKLTKYDILVNCKNDLGCEDKNNIMIGDTCHDAEAAQKLGIDFIGVTYGFGFKNKDDAEIYNPLFAANEPKEILEFFKK